MKHFEELEQDIDNRDLPEDIDAVNKIHCNELKTGKRIFWYYQEDLDFYEEGIGKEKVRDYKWDLYSGIIVPRPGIESHYGEWDIEDIVVVIDTAPSEKSYPEVFWLTLGRLLNSPDLVEIFESQDENHEGNMEESYE